MNERDAERRSPLRVLMTTDTVGGVWTYALELGAALAPLAVEVTLAAMGRLPSPAQAHAAAALDNVELVASTHALEWMADPWREVVAPTAAIRPRRSSARSSRRTAWPPPSAPT